LNPAPELAYTRNVLKHWVLERGFEDKGEFRNESLGLKNLKIEIGETDRFRRFSQKKTKLTGEK